MPRVITFGEIMLRLSPPGFERLFQSPVLSATFGGGEANVAASLAHFGLESSYVTRVPKQAIGDAAVRCLRMEGVSTEHVVRGGDRLGIYFAETGASQRASTVIYDRAGSSIAGMQPGMVDWPQVMHGAHWFHVTGITPALGASVAACTVQAMTAARQAGATVSLDLNYRRKLWSEAQAQATMRPMMAMVDVLIANEEDIQSVLGFVVPDADPVAGRVEPAAYEAVARQVERMEDAVEQVAPGFRTTRVGRQVQTPGDIQSADASLSRGALNAGTAALHQQLVLRPTRGLGRPETPLPGLYLASASAHPGGGVHGACGWNAAVAALGHRGPVGVVRRALVRTAWSRVLRDPDS